MRAPACVLDQSAIAASQLLQVIQRFIHRADHRSRHAPLIIELYELSPRERQVTELLLRGLPIEEIAAVLRISRYTVRDYTKAVFAKLGVGSRPELTAKLFHDHYLPAMDYAT